MHQLALYEEVELNYDKVEMIRPDDKAYTSKLCQDLPIVKASMDTSWTRIEPCIPGLRAYNENWIRYINQVKYTNDRQDIQTGYRGPMIF